MGKVSLSDYVDDGGEAGWQQGGLNNLITS